MTSSTEVIKLSNFINGQFVPPASGKYIDSFNPSTDEIWAHIPDSDERDAAAAVKAAKAAFPAYIAINALSLLYFVSFHYKSNDYYLAGGARLQLECAPASSTKLRTSSRRAWRSWHWPSLVTRASPCHWPAAWTSRAPSTISASSPRRCSTPSSSMSLTNLLVQ